MGVSSLPKTVTRHRRDCDLNPGPSAPESSTLTTRPVGYHLANKLLSLSVFVRLTQVCTSREFYRNVWTDRHGSAFGKEVTLT